MPLPPMLFHYTRRAAALEGILPSGKIRLGRLPRTNDPREFLPIQFSIAGYLAEEDDRLTLEDPIELGERADALLRESVHVLCLTEDSLDPDSPNSDFGDGPVRARMWAQYAENHAGLCLGFDRERLIEAATSQLKGRGGTRLIHGPVEYGQRHKALRRPTTLLQPEAESDLHGYIERIVEQHADALFFTKEWDWSTETEYRFLLRGETQEEEFIDIAGALKLVIVGPLFPLVYSPLVRSFCDALGARPFRLVWWNGWPVITGLRDARPQRPS